jgi:hypothetical protein
VRDANIDDQIANAGRVRQVVDDLDISALQTRARGNPLCRNLLDFRKETPNKQKNESMKLFRSSLDYGTSISYSKTVPQTSKVYSRLPAAGNLNILNLSKCKRIGAFMRSPDLASGRYQMPFATSPMKPPLPPQVDRSRRMNFIQHEQKPLQQQSTHVFHHPVSSWQSCLSAPNMVLYLKFDKSLHHHQNASFIKLVSSLCSPVFHDQRFSWQRLTQTLN